MSLNHSSLQAEPPLRLDQPAPARGRRILRLLLMGVALLVATAAGLAWYLVEGDKFDPVGDTGVFRSAQLDAETLKRRIREAGLRSLINLRGPNPDQPWYREQKAVLEDQGIEYRDIPLHARLLPPRELLQELYLAVGELPRPMLVHCLHGNDRSGLAALVIRLREPGSRLDDAAAEVSILRGVVFPDSAGKQLLAQYREWLGKGGYGHSPERFREFVDTGYLDAWGNFKYALERVGDQRAPGREEISVTSGTPQEVSGWAFDPQTMAPPEKVEILLGEQVAAQTRPAIQRSDVVAALGHKEALNSGWAQQIPPLKSPECVELRLRLTTVSGRTWTSPNQARLCPEGA